MPPTAHMHTVHAVETRAVRNRCRCQDAQRHGLCPNATFGSSPGDTCYKGSSTTTAHTDTEPLRNTLLHQNPERNLYVNADMNGWNVLFPPHYSRVFRLAVSSLSCVACGAQRGSSITLIGRFRQTAACSKLQEYPNRIMTPSSCRLHFFAPGCLAAVPATQRAGACL